MTDRPKLETYKDAEDWLISLTDYERMLGLKQVSYDTRTFDLEHFRHQLNGLGNPQTQFAVIHVAGTKGKGSTCAFLESALRHCGYKTGLYTSPHLYKFTERIRVNGAEIPDSDFCRLVETLGSLMTSGNDNEGCSHNFRTVFEILTASAFVYFAEHNIDIAVIETGLGGRLDSTNAFHLNNVNPLINVITTIGLDHTAILGDTIEAIAREKAGIIQSESTVVISPQTSPSAAQTVYTAVNERCRETGCAEPTIVSDNMHIEEGPDNQWTFLWTTPAKTPLAASLTREITLEPALEGRHQAANTATALTALVKLQELLINQPASVTGNFNPRSLLMSSIKAGIENTVWPGRFQVVEQDVPFVIDGAHCALSAAALAQTLKSHFPGKPAVIITGFLKDKAGEELLAAFTKNLNVVKAIGLAPPTPRAVESGQIQQTLEKIFGHDKTETADNMNSAIEAARNTARQINGYVAIFGSLYNIGPALEALSKY